MCTTYILRKASTTQLLRQGYDANRGMTPSTSAHDGFSEQDVLGGKQTPDITEPYDTQRDP